MQSWWLAPIENFEQTKCCWSESILNIAAEKSAKNIWVNAQSWIILYEMVVDESKFTVYFET